MKWLCSILTFANIATVSALLLGIVLRGLNSYIACMAVGIGAAATAIAYLKMSDNATARKTPDAKLSKRAQLRLEREEGLSQSRQPWYKYRHVWVWILAVMFAIFAVRSFCWLLYIDGTDLKIQSPNNLGDLALHLTHINYFANGVPLWPANPIYVFSAHLRYPAGIDLFNAILSCLHINQITGLVWTGLLASAATFYALYRWGKSFAVAGFLFNGGMIGFRFLHDWKFLDYQGGSNIAWKSIPLSMFVTQRGLLYALPAGLILLWHWREKYFGSPAVSAPTDSPAADLSSGPPNTSTNRLLPFWVELSLYASMPLFHLHTFIALTIVLVCFFALGDRIVRGHVLILLISAFIPATFFTWLITDHFMAKSVLEWHPGWVQGWTHGDDDFNMRFFKFWLFNFGMLVPLVLTLAGFCSWRLIRSDKNQALQLGVLIGVAVAGLSIFRLFVAPFSTLSVIILVLAVFGIGSAVSRLKAAGYDWSKKFSEEAVFLTAAGAIFLLTFFIKFAPWGWDNLKIMIWAYFILLPVLWKYLITEWDLSIRVAVCFALFGSGFVSLFGGLAAPGFAFADRGELDGVGYAVRSLPIEARFAAFPTYNHPLLLQGRKVVLGYPGHLWTQGFDDYEKANDLLKKLMLGSENWQQLARDLKVRYIFWGREENTNYAASKKPWEKVLPVVKSGTWGTIYDLQQAQASR